MIIRRKRIRSVEKYINYIPEDKEFYVCVKNNAQNIEILRKNNLCASYEVGHEVIVKAIGPITKYNIDGKYIVHKDQEKEQRTYEREYHVVDWHGEDHYGTCFQTRYCYPKEYIIPPLEKIVFEENIIRSNIVKRKDQERVKHIINLFLEIFGYCEIVDIDTQPINKQAEVRTVQWKILPKGKYPWDEAKNHLQQYFKAINKKKRVVIEERHKKIADHTTDFVAIGQDSFNGYVVYGFISKQIFIFESNELNNATYVFKGEWEQASKLTKREIILGDKCYKRIIHTQQWYKQIELLLQ